MDTCKAFGSKVIRKFQSVGYCKTSETPRVSCGCRLLTLEYEFSCFHYLTECSELLTVAEKLLIQKMEYFVKKSGIFILLKTF